MKRSFLLVLMIAGLTICATAQSKAGKQKSKAPAAGTGDIPTTVADSVGNNMKFIEGSFLGVAEAMPENKYDFIPTGGNFEGVRSFREQVKHVACAQFAFFNEFEGK
ncbi:MAG TPA: hypothetical protein VI424_16610, partial [Terriglobales bacterium]